MRLFYIGISAVLTGIFFMGCTKVGDLSDDAGIDSFTITRVSEGIELATDRVDISDNTVTIPLEFGRKNFPLTISADVRFSSTTDDAISTDEQPLNLKSFTFEDVYTVHKFYLVAESGQPHLTQIKLQDKLNAEIQEFSLNLPEEDASVTIWQNNIRITLKKSLGWPFTFTPTIVKTPGAVYKNYKDGEALTFASPADNTRQIVIVADNEDEKVWNIQIVPSIENSDFELWINENNPKKINIDPTPGEGMGWATANNSFVQGTRPVDYKGGKAAQMTTELQSIGFIGDLVTSGTLFTGYFKMNISALNNPPLMTYFGIPFVLKPVSVSFEAKYAAGNKLQQSVKNKDNLYELKSLEGADQGRMWVKVLRWEGKGNIDYHEKPVDGLIVLGEGEQIFDGNDASLKNWKDYIVRIQYDPEYRHLQPTHIAIVFTSSRQGDLFVGAIGSMLTVDNVEINY